MAGRDVVGEAVLLLELDDHASSEMAAAVAEFRAEAAALGREKAEIKVTAHTEEAKRKLKELLAEEKALAAEEKKIQRERDASQRQQKAALTRQLNGKRAEIAATRQNIAATKDEVAALERKGKVARDVNRMATQLTREQTKAEKDLAKQVKDSEKAEASRGRTASAWRRKMEQATRSQAAAERSAEKARADAAKAEARASADLEKRARAHAAATQADANAQRAAGISAARDFEKQMSLQSRYAAAQKRFNELNKSYGRARGSEKIQVEVDGARALAEMTRIREELRLIGAKPVDINARVKTDGNALQRGAKGLLGAFGFNRTDQIKGATNDLKRLAGAAKDARVNVGPLSTSIGGLVVGGAALAPIISGLIGTLGALVSVAGAGLAGALGTAAAAAGGFSFATVGMGAALKPYIQGVVQAHKYTKAYSAVVAKYGSDSKQAHKAQDVLNHQMSGIPKVSRDAAIGISQISGEWKRATQGAAQKSFGNIVGSSLQTVKALLPSFASDTNHALGAVSKGWQGWMQQLRSPGAQSAIHNIFSSFNQSIPSIMHGLGSLGTAFGRIVSAFAGHLPTLANGFASWAKHIADATSNSGHLHSTISRLVSAMQSLGHFAQAGGRFLLSFFKAGIGPGVSLVNQMTSGLNKLTAQMNTTAGQNKLQGFFQRSIATTKQLWEALKPIGSAFLSLGRALAPVSRVALGIVGAIAKVVGALASFKPFQFAAGFLVALAIVGRLTAGLREAGSLVLSFGGNLGRALNSMVHGGGIIPSLKNAFSSAGSAGELEAALTAGGATAASEIGAAFTAGSAEVAAAIEGAMASGGATLGAESAATSALSRTPGGVLLPAGASAGLAAEAGGIAATGTAAAAAAPEIAAAEAASTGLGAALGGFATLGVVGVIAGIGLAISSISNNSNNAKDAVAGMQQALRGLATVRQGVAGAAGLSDLRGNTFQASSQLPAAIKETNALQATYNRLTQQGKTNTAQFRDTQQQLAQSISNRDQLQQQEITSQQQATAAHKTAARQIDQGLRSAYQGLAKASANYGATVKEAKIGAADIRDVAKAYDAQTKAQAAVTAALKARQAAEFQLATDTLNSQRVMAGMPQVTNQYAQSVGRLSTQIDQYGRKADQAGAKKLLINTPDPAQLARLGNTINKLSPKDRTAAINVTANSANAQQALNRINSTVIKPKVLQLTTNLGDTLAKLSEVNGKKLSAKTLRLLHAGDGDTIAKVAQINGLRLPAKVLKLLGDLREAQHAHDTVAAYSAIQKLFTMLGDPGPALRAFQAVQAGVHNITAAVTLNATQIVTRIFRSQGSASPPPITQYVHRPGPGTGAHSVAGHHKKAAGGPGSVPSGFSNQPTLRAKQTRAAMQTIDHKPITIRSGGAFDKPVLLVGEENRREYVIATNPAYRQNNVGYLAQAAKEFGYSLVAAAKGKLPAVQHQTGSPIRHGKFRNSVYDLPDKDRIGGVGTADIDAAIQSAQTAYDNYNQKIHSHQDKKGHKLNPSRSETAHLKDYYGARLNQLKGLSSSANRYIQEFSNLENDIQTVGHFMDFADSATDARYGPAINPVNGKNVSHNAGTWEFWKAQDQELQSRHVSKLRAAYNDARAKVGKNTNATNLGYISTLGAALGAAVVEQQGVNISKKTEDVASATPALTLETLMDAFHLTDSLNQELYGYSVAQGNNTVDLPGTPQREDLDSLTDDRAYAKALMDFYASKVIPLANATHNYPVMTDAQDAYNQWRSTWQGLDQQFTDAATAGGPSQFQIFDTARSNMLEQYGSNAIMRAMGGPVSAGGSSALAALSAVGSPPMTMAAQGSSGSGDTNVSVTNHFATAPEDPHSWSSGTAWELQHLI